MTKHFLPKASTTSLLVKDGIVITMEKVVTCLGFTSHTKLRLSLNVISCLTKNSKNAKSHSA